MASGLIRAVTPFSPTCGYKSGRHVAAEVRDGTVVDASTAVKDWIGWDARDLWRMQRRRGVHVEWVPDH